MGDYKEKIDEWQRAARRKARELDEKYAISDLVEEGSRVAERGSQARGRDVRERRRESAV